jgi:hypothetical protein
MSDRWFVAPQAEHFAKRHRVVSSIFVIMAKTTSRPAYTDRGLRQRCVIPFTYQVSLVW